MALLSNKDQILAIDDLVVEEVDVPEWGGSVLLKALTAAERDRFESETVQQRGNDRRINLINFRARLVALCMVNEDRKRIFEGDDVKRLGRKSANALNRLFNKCQDMNGMSAADVEDLTDGSDALDDAVESEDDE